MERAAAAGARSDGRRLARPYYRAISSVTGTRAQEAVGPGAGGQGATGTGAPDPRAAAESVLGAGDQGADDVLWGGTTEAAAARDGLSGGTAAVQPGAAPGGLHVICHLQLAGGPLLPEDEAQALRALESALRAHLGPQRARPGPERAQQDGPDNGPEAEQQRLTVQFMAAPSHSAPGPRLLLCPDPPVFSAAALTRTRPRPGTDAGAGTGGAAALPRATAAAPTSGCSSGPAARGTGSAGSGGTDTGAADSLSTRPSLPSRSYFDPYSASYIGTGVGGSTAERAPPTQLPPTCTRTGAPAGPESAGSPPAALPPPPPPAPLPLLAAVPSPFLTPLPPPAAALAAAPRTAPSPTDSTATGGAAAAPPGPAAGATTLRVDLVWDRILDSSHACEGCGACDDAGQEPRPSHAGPWVRLLLTQAGAVVAEAERVAVGPGGASVRLDASGVEEGPASLLVLPPPRPSLPRPPSPPLPTPHQRASPPPLGPCPVAPDSDSDPPAFHLPPLLWAPLAVAPAAVATELGGLWGAMRGAAAEAWPEAGPRLVRARAFTHHFAPLLSDMAALRSDVAALRNRTAAMPEADGAGEASGVEGDACNEEEEGAAAVVAAAEAAAGGPPAGAAVAVSGVPTTSGPRGTTGSEHCSGAGASCAGPGGGVPGRQGAAGGPEVGVWECACVSAEGRAALRAGLVPYMRAMGLHATLEHVMLR